MDQRQDLVVVGGGIAGLAAAVTAAEGGARVTVVDAHPLGGRARTQRRDGVSLNLGPHALYQSGTLQALLDHHGIAAPGRVPELGSLRLERAGELVPFSPTPWGLVSTPLVKARRRHRLLGFLARLPRLRPELLTGRSVREWLSSEPDDVADLIHTLIQVATYTNAPEILDAGAAARQLQLVQDGVRYVDGGWQTIVDGLAARLQALGGQTVTGCLIERVDADDVSATVVTTTGILQADGVVVATGGPDVAERLTGCQVAGRDRLGPRAEVSVLDLVVEPPHPGVVFGIDRPLYLSPHAPAARLVPDGQGLVTLARYHPLHDDIAAADDRSELRDLARRAGIGDDQIVRERFLARETVVHGVPSASGGGLAGRPAIDALGLPGVWIAGDWVGPEGMLADAAAASGQAAGRAALARCGRIAA